MLQKIIEKILKFWARRVLLKQKPKIVTVTGSVGKSSAKEAIYAVLSSRFKVRRSVGNYNNEIGAPLTIIGCESAGKNIFLWKWVFCKAFILNLLKSKNYPEILVLEIGADKPGDLKYLMEMLPRELLKAAVLTAVAPVHLEFFGTPENIFKEKTTPFQYLPKDGKAIVNKDYVDYREADIFYSIEDADDKMLGRFIFRHQAYALLAAIAVGKVFDISEQKAKEVLERDYQVLPGRGKKIKGIKGSILIDDTYNASPLSTRAALRAVANLPYGKRKIAVLGDMLELGPQSPQFHKQIGEIAAELEFNCLITYGQEAKNISSKAKHFQEQEKLIDFLQNFIQEGDVVLVKGSQGARMEKITKALMVEPERAKELLVRQSKKWLKK